MGSYKASVALCFVGVAVALIPTILYIAYAQELSSLKILEIEFVSGIPIYLLFSFAGIVITLVGLVMLVRSVRHALELTTPRARTRPTPRAVTPTVVRPAQAIGPTTQQPIRRVEEVVKSIEKELEEVITKTTAEQHVHPPAPQQEAPPPQKISIKVITAGGDEVCPSCGAINPLGQKVCVECGANIYVEDPSLPACPVCGAPLKDPQKLTDKIYVCRICFSELEIPKDLSKKL